MDIFKDIQEEMWAILEEIGPEAKIREAQPRVLHLQIRTSSLN